VRNTLLSDSIWLTLKMHCSRARGYKLALPSGALVQLYFKLLHCDGAEPQGSLCVARSICSRPDGSQWVLGAGSFGKVFKATWARSDGCVLDVAMKMIISPEAARRRSLCDRLEADFIREMALMKYLCSRDTHMVPFHGACVFEGRLCLVLELMQVRLPLCNATAAPQRAALQSHVSALCAAMLHSENVRVVIYLLASLCNSAAGGNAATLRICMPGGSACGWRGRHTSRSTLRTYRQHIDNHSRLCDTGRRPNGRHQGQPDCRVWLVRKRPGCGAGRSPRDGLPALEPCRALRPKVQEHHAHRGACPLFSSSSAMVKRTCFCLLF